MRPARLATVALLLLLSGACAARTTAGASPRRDSRLIRLDEIQNAASTGVGNAYDLILRLHPEWLRPIVVGVEGRTIEPSVWLDGQRLGGLSALRSVPLGAFAQVRFMNPSEAHGELGLDNLGGAIALRSGR